MLEFKPLGYSIFSWTSYELKIEMPIGCHSLDVDQAMTLELRLSNHSHFPLMVYFPIREAVSLS